MLNLKRSKKLVLGIIPFGVTGSGKTTFRKKLTEMATSRFKWAVKYVSSDETRREAMDEILKSSNGSFTKE